MNAKPSDLVGRTALVTGAAKRLGRGVSLALADSGVSVIAHFNSSSAPAAELAEQLRTRGVKAWTIQADLACPEQVATLMARARDVAGPVDILINNASIFPADTFKDATPESIALNEQVNAVAPFLLMRDLAAQGIEADIINFLDTRIVDVDPGHTSYHISKRTLFTLTQIAALELAPRIKVNAVAPGLILPPEGKDESYLAGLAHTNPLRRYGSPEAISQAVLFLLKAKFITGQVIYVDGGRHLKGSFYGGC
jgi:pteridine reductase